MTNTSVALGKVGQRLDHQSPAGEKGVVMSFELLMLGSLLSVAIRNEPAAVYGKRRAGFRNREFRRKLTMGRSTVLLHPTFRAPCVR